MDENKRRALLRSRDTITHSLDVFQITDDLYTREVIFDSEYRYLLDEKVRNRNVYSFNEFEVMFVIVVIFFSFYS